MLQNQPINNLPQIRKPSSPLNLKSSLSNTIQLNDISLDWNLNFLHQQRTKSLTAISDTLGAGVCALDYNNDGWTDLYFVGGSGNTRRYGRTAWWHKTSSGRLYKNHQGQYLQDVTANAGLELTIPGMSCAVEDINADGFEDIVITGINAFHLFKNNGNNSFSDISKKSGITPNGWTTGAAFGDFNNDGLPDLYIPKFINFKKDATTFEAQSGFQSYNSAAFQSSLYDAEPNHLYVNTGGFSFREVTEKFGVGNQNGRSLGARWIDINTDNWLDLIVINQHPSPNEIYINNKGNEFSLANSAFNSLRGTGNHDLIQADFNNNGQIDFFLTAESKNPIQLLEYNYSKNHTDAKKLHDVSQAFGLTDTKLTQLTHWGAISGDFNNDSYQDIFIANGKLTPDPDSHFMPLSQPNSLLLNQMGNHFSIIDNSEKALTSNSSRTAITTDLNNDGQLEIIVSNNNGAIQILEPKPINETYKTPYNWIGFKFTNMLSINKRLGQVKITYNNKKQLKNLSMSPNFLSQSEQRLHFGLRDSKKIDQITIQLAEKSFTITNLAANHYYTIDLLTEETKKLTYTHTKDPFKPLVEHIDTNALYYLARIVLKNGKPEQIASFTKVWKHTNSQQRLLLLNSFNQIDNLFQLKTTLLGLSDSNTEVVIKAIQLLKRSEIEQTMGALINQLYVNNVDIQCATTKALSFFFNEEEAMLFQKKLALKHLIKVLENGKKQAQICSAKTLGASESKRAVIALLKLISTTNKHNSQIKLAAIDALSEIRDSRAINKLITLIRAVESKPDEIGAALIALARMHSNNLPDLLQHTIYSKLKSNNKPTQIKAIHILSSIYQHENVIFINPHLHQKNTQTSIINIIDQLLPDLSPYLDKKELSLALSVINIIDKTRNISLINFLQSASNLNNSKIRNSAILALLRMPLTTNEQKEIIQNTLAKQSIETLIKLLKLQTETGKITSTSPALITTIENKIHHSNLTAKQLKETFNSLDKKTNALLISKLLTNNVNTQKQQKLLLNICTEMQTSINVSALEKLINKPDIKKEFLACIYNPNASHTSLPIALSYQLRKMLNKLLNNNELDIHHHQILAEAMLHDSVIATHFLSKHSEHFSQQNISTALLAIEHHKLSNQYESLIWKTIKNTANSDILRMQAAWLANLISPDKTTMFLQKDFLVQ